jgi:Holliday junction DNA helicase RuvA
MIGYLSGTPQLVQDKVLIKTGGVGYEVSVGMTTLAQLISLPTAELYIHTHVKEEALELYGFLTLDERSLFRLLLSVSGVGPKTALAIANTGADALRIAVQQADVGFFTAVPRVGKKLAQKIIIELKSKLGSLNELQLDTPTGASQDILSALMALGFDEQSSLRELHLVTEEISELPVEQSIKLIIKRLSKS